MPRKVLRLWNLLLFLIMIWFTWRATDYYTLNAIPNATIEYSFLASLHAFLAKHSETLHMISRVSSASEGLIGLRDNGERFDKFNIAASLTLNVYVYEMPTKFTTNLLWLFQSTLEQTENLTSNGSPVHRLIQQVYLRLTYVELFFSFYKKPLWLLMLKSPFHCSSAPHNSCLSVFG